MKIFIPGSVEDFKRWLQQKRKKQRKVYAVPKTLAPARMPKSRSKINATELLRIIKEAGQATSAQVAEKLNIDPVTAGNQIKILQQKGLVEVVGKVKRRPVFAPLVNGQPKPIKRNYKGPMIRDQVIEYFKSHDTGSNTDIAHALGKRASSNVGLITIRLLLEGVLTAQTEKHPVSGKTHRIFSLSKETLSNGRS